MCPIGSYKCPQKNNNTPTHPMTMPLKRLVKTAKIQSRTVSYEVVNNENLVWGWIKHFVDNSPPQESFDGRNIV